MTPPPRLHPEPMLFTNMPDGDNWWKSSRPMQLARKSPLFESVSSMWPRSASSHYYDALGAWGGSHENTLSKLSPRCTVTWIIVDIPVWALSGRFTSCTDLLCPRVIQQCFLNVLCSAESRRTGVRQRCALDQACGMSSVVTSAMRLHSEVFQTCFQALWAAQAQRPNSCR